MRQLCPAPVISPDRALDHMLVAPEVLALQPRLLAPVDLLHHLPGLVLGDLLPHHHDGDQPLPAPDDGSAKGMKTFFVFSECFSDQDVQRIANDDFSLLPAPSAGILWRRLRGSAEGVMAAGGTGFSSMHTRPIKLMSGLRVTQTIRNSAALHPSRAV